MTDPRIKRIAKLITEDPDIFNEGWLEDTGIEDPFKNDSAPLNDECARIQQYITKVWDRVSKNTNWDTDHFFENNKTWLQNEKHVASCPTCSAWQEEFYKKWDAESNQLMDNFLDDVQNQLDTNPDTMFKGMDAKKRVADIINGTSDEDDWKPIPLTCKEAQELINDLQHEDEESYDNLDNDLDEHIRRCPSCRAQARAEEDELTLLNSRPWHPALNTNVIMQEHPTEEALKAFATRSLSGGKHPMDTSFFHVMKCSQCAQKIQNYYDQF